MKYFLVINQHRPDTQDQRAEIRGLHVAWITSGGEGLVSVLTGAPTKAVDAGEEGNFFVLEAPSLVDAEGFAQGDPFRRAGLVGSSQILALQAPFDPEAIAQTLSPRLVPAQD